MTHDNPRRVVVVGGGIAGLATGLALARTGHDVVILERQSGEVVAAASGGWHLWSNAMQALAALGVDAEVRRHGAHLERTEFVSAAGKPIATWPIGQIGRRLRATDVGISRQVLHRILREEYCRLVGPSGLREGAVVTGVDTDGGSLQVREQDGAVHPADVVVGADGIRSTLRTRISGAVAPRYAGYVQWQGVLPRSATTAWTSPPGTELVVFGRRARAVVHEIGDDQLFWAAILYGRAELRTAAGARDRLLRQFARFPEPFVELIAATPESAMNAHAIHDLPPQRHWVDDAIALVGDAAHAMTTNLSQGACLALEDALVLAECLGSAFSATDIPSALSSYEARRQQRAQPVARRSWKIAGLGGWRSRPAVAVRDQLMRVTLSTVALRDHERFVAMAPRFAGGGVNGSVEGVR
jgi:2-polyprenyl-6-methoxyphenol hydroxylase-like FAD-dependent oxidoreductase